MAELIVAADLVKRGFRLAFPFGEDSDFDLLFWRPPSEQIERVQVKYATSDGEVLQVRARSHSLTGGRVRATKHYTSASIDWIAVFDATTNGVFYVPAGELGDGMYVMHLRLVPARNNQRRRVRMAQDYLAPTIRRAGP
jgi:PD-(D/E)XK nuclease superfamily protein